MRLATLARPVTAAASGLLLFGDLLAQATHALAGSFHFNWCWDDHLVRIDGVTQSITVDLQSANLAQLKDQNPVAVTLYVAQNLKATVPAAQPSGPFPMQTQVVLANTAAPSSALTVTDVNSVNAKGNIPIAVELLNSTGETTGTGSASIVANFMPLSASFFSGVSQESLKQAKKPAPAALGY